MQDIAPSYASVYLKEWLTSGAIFRGKIIEGTPFLPDLNCIENFWASLKRRISVDGRQFTTNDTLWEVLQDAARSFSPYEITKYTNSMNKMLFQLIPNHGNCMNYGKFFSDTLNSFIVII